jgi:hypothetical protein
MRVRTHVLAFAALVLGACAASPVPTAVTPTPGKNPVYDFARYPDRVWDRHQTLTRQAASSCGASSFTRGGYIGCIYSTLDNYVRVESNPALSDLHVHLPLYYRYNPDRNQRPTALLPNPYPTS